VLTGFGLGSTIFALLNLGAWAVALAQHNVNIRAAPEAIYTSANSVALYLEPAVGLALGLVLYGPGGLVRKLAFAWLAVLVVASILTLSRGLYVAFGFVILFAVLTLTSLRVRFAIVGAAIVATLATLQVPYISVRVFGQHGPETTLGSLEQRLSIWTSSIHLIRDHPIFGIGLRAIVGLPHLPDRADRAARPPVSDTEADDLDRHRGAAASGADAAGAVAVGSALAS